MKSVHLVSALCAIAVLATGVTAWASASGSVCVTGRLVSEMYASGPVLPSDHHLDVAAR